MSLSGTGFFNLKTMKWIASNKLLKRFFFKGLRQYGHLRKVPGVSWGVLLFEAYIWFWLMTLKGIRVPSFLSKAIGKGDRLIWVGLQQIILKGKTPQELDVSKLFENEQGRQEIEVYEQILEDFKLFDSSLRYCLQMNPVAASQAVIHSLKQVGLESLLKLNVSQLPHEDRKRIALASLGGQFGYRDRKWRVLMKQRKRMPGLPNYYSFKASFWSKQVTTKEEEIVSRLPARSEDGCLSPIGPNTTTTFAKCNVEGGIQHASTISEISKPIHESNIFDIESVICMINSLEQDLMKFLHSDQSIQRGPDLGAPGNAHDLPKFPIGAKLPTPHLTEIFLSVSLKDFGILIHKKGLVKCLEFTENAIRISSVLVIGISCQELEYICTDPSDEFIEIRCQNLVAPSFLFPFKFKQNALKNYKNPLKSIARVTSGMKNQTKNKVLTQQKSYSSRSNAEVGNVSNQKTFKRIGDEVVPCSPKVHSKKAEQRRAQSKDNQREFSNGLRYEKPIDKLPSAIPKPSLNSRKNEAPKSQNFKTQIPVHQNTKSKVSNGHQSKQKNSEHHSSRTTKDSPKRSVVTSYKSKTFVLKKDENVSPGTVRKQVQKYEKTTCDRFLKNHPKEKTSKYTPFSSSREKLAEGSSAGSMRKTSNAASSRQKIVGVSGSKQKINDI